VESVGAGTKAVERAAAGRFDIILMDCQLPEMDGIAAARCIRRLETHERRAHVPIIAVTASAFAEDEAACLEAGMNDYIRKPFTEDELRAVLTKWSAGKRTAAPATSAADAPAPEIPRSALPPTRPAGHAVSATEPPAAVAHREVGEVPSLDPEVIGRMRKTYASLLKRLVETYADYAPGAIVDLDKALASSSAEALCNTAHALKSSSANIGANRLSALCRELEARIRKSSDWDGPANLAAVDAIKTEYAGVAAELAALRLELAGPETAQPSPAANGKASA
jgi:CheY-like chemotaxis protein